MLLYDVSSQIWRIMPPGSRRKLVRLWGFLTLTSLVEVVGISCWYPFATVLLDRGAIKTSRWLSYLHRTAGLQSEQAFLLLLGGVVILGLLGTSLFRMAAEWCSCRFAWGERLRLGELLLSRYLSQPYEWFLRKNSAELVRNVLTEVPWVVDGCILHLCRVYTAFVLTGVIVVGIVAIDPWVAITTTAVIGGIFALIYRGVRWRLTELGRLRLVESDVVTRSVTESISSVKEAKIPPWLCDFTATFRLYQSRVDDLSLSQRLLTIIPGHLTEMTAKVGVLLVAIYLILTNAREALALIGVYIVAVVRVAPEAHYIYKDLSGLRFYKPALDKLQDLLVDDPSARPFSSRERLPMTQALRLENVCFTYGGCETEVLKEVSLEVSLRTSLALVGETGAGKTTLADVLSGILSPRSGVVLVDGQVLDDERRRLWRNNIGYVPQQIYLTDDTVRRNIAFGVPSDQIDDQAVRAAATAANIHAFVSEDLKEGYETILGERGVCLSGGQRQRIGIARALYRDPEFLIFDEATSALDNVTEKVILDALESLARKKTIVVIAHRLSTVIGCDRICLLQDGRVEAIGTYDDLLRTCPPFRAMVHARRQEPAGVARAPAVAGS